MFHGGLLTAMEKSPPDFSREVAYRRQAYPRIVAFARDMTRLSTTLLHLDTRRLDHLGGIVDFVADELAEFGRRHRHRFGAECGQPLLHLGCLQHAADVAVDLVDDVGGPARR